MKDGLPQPLPRRKKSLTYVLRRIYLLLWKNVLFRKRHYFVTTFEVILPTLLALLMAFLRTRLDEGSYKVVDRISMFPPTTEQELMDYTNINILCNDCVLAFTPVNPLTEEILKRFKDKVQQSEFALKGFETEKALEQFAAEADLKSAYNDPKLKAAIVFDGFDNKEFIKRALNGSFPNEFKAKYRFRPAAYNVYTENLFEWFQFPGPELENAAKYTLGGYTGVQILLDRVLIELMTGIETTQEIQTQVFPYPPYVEVKDFSQFYFILLPQLLVLGFIFIVPSTIRNVVSERESGIKELMKLMGLPNWMHWLGWMMNSLLVLSLSITIVVFLLFYTFNEKTGAVIAHSDPTVWWFVLFLFVTAATSFCFFISTFSERPTLATTFGVVLWMVSYYGLSVPLEAKYRTLTLTEKLSAALIPNMGLHWAIKVMCGFEGKAAGAVWSNFWEPISDVDRLSVGNICAMFVVDIILYTLLTLYLEAILPSKYGIRRPWYFFFKPSTWITPTQKVTIRRQSIYSLQEIDKPGFEPEPENLSPGVVIHKLTKKFGNKKTAVNEISIRMYEGQITALLGHNGAGKTTTMSMLTGLFPPTSGNAYLSGYDIKHQLDEARESLGLCPQHNMLFDQLTVQEHLVFFGRIKGLRDSEARKESRILLKKLQLNDKKHARSSNLSGGQKRKLSLGMALIGGTKVVILDEPTSGMDPEARRVIWDLLLEMRGKRTIVLTTHFMEEADILGDRVAIMTHGKIECYGTPMFLKKYYGTGYTLKMTIIPSASAKDILQRVQKHFPKCFLKTAHTPNSAEVAISIPSEEDTTSKFPNMFLHLSNDKESLGILNIGLSLTTMDEVFVKIGEVEESSNQLIDDEGSRHSENGNHKDQQTTSFSTHNGDRNGSRTHLKEDKLSGFQLLKLQISGLLKKKMIYTLRKRKLLISQFLISPLLLIGAIYLSTHTSSPSVNAPPLTMTLASYNNPKTLFYSYNDTVGSIYEGLVGASAIQIEDDIIGQLVTLGAVDLGKFRQEYIVGAQFNESIVTALFSSIPYHAAPLSVNLVTNAILKAYSPHKHLSIQVTVHPLQNDLFNILESAQPNASLSLFVPIIFGAFVPIGLALFAASYIVFPIEERTSKAKQLQLMSGVNTVVFWGTSFLWDLFLIGLAISIILLCFPIFQTNETYTSNGGFFVILLILVIWGFSSLSFAYFFSFIVSTPAGGFALKTIFNIAFGMLFPIILFIINNFQKELDTSGVSFFGRIFPIFGASVSIMRYASLATQNSRCSILSDEDKSLFCNPELEVDPLLLQCCDNCANFSNPFGPSCFVPEDFMSWSYKLEADSILEHPGIPQEIFYMLLVGIFYQFIFIVIEFGGIRRCCWRVFCRTGTKRFSNPVQDEDVLNEKIRVKDLLQTGRSQEDGFLVTNLCKNYGNFAAVSNLNFGVHHGECFGLLGVNGAGKTTTFKMITGDEIPSNGNAYGFMRTLQNHRKEFLSNIGYCPQFDAIIGVLTGRELLGLYASLRGIPSHKKEVEVNKWLRKLGLSKEGNVKSEQYSGGMKRRLSVGMAMIGDPPIVLLDEPTSGVDPVARRQFWKVIASLKGSSQCVILTSHSMEECEALCSRLGIMVNGQLQCLGGVQHLKSKFAKGFSLVLRLKPDVHSDDAAAYALKKDIANKLNPCELKDEHQNVLQYQILNTEMPWNLIFEIVEECKTQHADIIEDYSVSETTLEEVFLSFARKQYQSRDTDLSLLRKILPCRC